MRMFFTLSGLAQLLADNGIHATVYDNYMDPSIPPHAILIESNVDENVIMTLIGPMMPWGLHVMFRNPENDRRYFTESEPQSCICIGPPSKDCHVHGDVT